MKKGSHMIYTNFQDKQLSLLGFGTMRLPTLPDGSIDQPTLEAMTDLAMASGVNYFDTAYPYHDGLSELAIASALRKYPRDSYFLADKYPGHQISSSYYPAEIFEEQLRKCGVEYFDFYLLHNVYENSMDVYLDEAWGILDYFREQKRLGRIRHLGFSTHASTETMAKFLDIAGEDMEFCQIQLNWLDRTLQDGENKVKLLNERNIPIWVMEPVRGGKLCQVNEEEEKALKAHRPDESVAAWGFRYLQDVPGVTMILSGMSNMAQMEDNIKTFSSEIPLCEEEKQLLFAIAEGMKRSVPCTACRYCTASCPMELDIPNMLATLSELRVDAKTNPTMWLEALPADRQPSSCIGCGACTHICPQKIDIPAAMSELAALLTAIPKWSDICRRREEAARRLREGK